MKSKTFNIDHWAKRLLGYGSVSIIASFLKLSQDPIFVVPLGLVMIIMVYQEQHCLTDEELKNL